MEDEPKTIPCSINLDSAKPTYSEQKTHGWRSYWLTGLNLTCDSEQCPFSNRALKYGVKSPAESIEKVQEIVRDKLQKIKQGEDLHFDVFMRSKCLRYRYQAKKSA